MIKKSIFMLILFFISIAIIATPVSAELKTINPGAPVYIGEGDLDISHAVGENNKIAWWPAPTWGQQPTLNSKPLWIIDVSPDKNSFYVDPNIFAGYTGNWYSYSETRATTSNSLAFVIYDPDLDIQVWNLDINEDVTGKVVAAGDRITFLIKTNQYKALNPSYRPNANPDSDGFITIKMKNPNGAVLNSLYETNTISHSLTNQSVNLYPWFWGGTLSKNIGQQALLIVTITKYIR